MKIFKRIAAALATVALAVLPLATSRAAEQVAMESRVNVANVTSGDTQYQKSVNAKTDDVVKVELWYHNKENADSGKVANNVKVKIDLPTAQGKTQTITSTVSADNASATTDNAVVNATLANANLEYVPGSAMWRHNTGTNEAPNWVTQPISDNVVKGGVTLGNENPCFNFEATVTILARVKASAVSVTKQVRVLGC
jgi:hypothetical protein